MPPDNDDESPPRAPTSATAAASDFIVPGSISHRAIEAFVEQALAADPVRVDWRRLVQWRELDASRVTVPVLLLQGEFDPLALDEVHTSFFGSLGTRDKSWIVLPGGDHAAFMETPRAYFLASIGNFLYRHP